jgi:hypothetical protein
MRNIHGLLGIHAQIEGVHQDLGEPWGWALPPITPINNSGRPSRSTIAGRIEWRGRWPGARALGWPG